MPPPPPPPPPPQEATLPASPSIFHCWSSSTTSQNQQISPPHHHPWFTNQSNLDTQIVSEALQRELAARKHIFFNSHSFPPLDHSLADTYNQFFSSPLVAAITTTTSTAATSNNGTWVLNSANPINATSPMSTSDRVSQPGSPFNSCANSASCIFPLDDCKTLSGFQTDETQIGFPMDKQEGSVCATANAISNSSLRNATEKLSAQASVGLGVTKVSKRRSRASNKPPITVLPADTTNFRAMVHKLTGIPTSPPAAVRNKYHFWDTPSAASILKPRPCQPSQSIHSLPTLDTSAFLLVDGPLSLNQNNRLQHSDSLFRGFTGLSPVSQKSKSRGDDGVVNLGLNRNSSNFPSVTDSDIRALFPNLMSDSCNKEGNNSMPKLWDLVNGSSLNEAGEGMRECFLNQNDSKDVSTKSSFSGKLDTEQFNKRQAAALESFLMGNDKADFDSSTPSLHCVDSWLSPQMELTHTV